MFPGVCPCFLTTALTQTSFQWHRLLSSNASTKVRDENTPERKFAWTGYRTHNHQVMSLTRSPLSHPDGGPGFWNLMRCHCRKKFSGSTSISTLIFFSTQGSASIAYCRQQPICKRNFNNCWLIVWSLTPFLTLFRLYHGGQCTYTCFPCHGSFF